MLPLSDSVPTRRAPWINLLLIAANVAVFVYELSLGPGLDAFIVRWGLVPVRVSEALAGAPGTSLAILLTLLTATFLHAGWLHIGGNMLYLWIFGDNVEDRLGHLGYLVFYLSCGIGANLVTVAADPTSRIPNLGASGAIAGVLGAYFITYPGASVAVVLPILLFFTVVDIPAILVLGLWFAMQFLGEFQTIGQAASGGVAWTAHIGGFLLGVVLMIAMPKDDQSKYYAQSRWTYAEPRHRGGFAAFLIAVISIVGEALQAASLAHAALAAIGLAAFSGLLNTVLAAFYALTEPIVAPFGRYARVLPVDRAFTEVVASILAFVAFYVATAFLVWLIAALAYRRFEHAQARGGR